MAARRQALALVLALCGSVACQDAPPDRWDDDAGPTDEATAPDTGASDEASDTADSETETSTESEECLVDPPDRMVMDLVTAVSEPVDQVATISFRSSEDARVEVSTALGALHRDMIVNHQEHGDPVYLRLGPVDRLVEDVLWSISGPVVAVAEEDEGLAVQLLHSAAIHFVRRASPCYDHLGAELFAALDSGEDVIVTEEQYEEGIIDVRPPFAP